jgi:hypothetical protein
MRIWRKRDGLSELARELRATRPEPRREFVRALAQRVDDAHARRPARALRLGLAGALTAAMLVALAAFGGMGYAASTANTVVNVATKLVKPQKPSGTSDINAAAVQYGKKVSICTVQRNGKQHTITISKNAVPHYLATHPKAYRGSCGALRPRGAKPNVCVRLANGRTVPVYVPPSKQNAYLRRNAGSHRTKTGKC